MRFMKEIVKVDEFGVKKLSILYGIGFSKLERGEVEWI